MSRRTLVKGAATLGAAGIIVKVLGAVFMLPLVNWIGSLGMANYSPAYYIYNFFLILSTAGIPVAISKMVSERIAVNEYNEAHRVFNMSLILMISIGVVSFVILFFLAPQISYLCGNRQAEMAMRAIAPCLIFVPVEAAYRGYFQGMQNMRPTAVSQVVEQIFRVVAGLILAYMLFNMTSDNFLTANSNRYERGAAGATFGATAGAIGGTLIILLIYLMSKKAIRHRIRNSVKGRREAGSTIFKKIFIIAVPITIGAAIMPIMNLVDATVVMNRLQTAGFGYTQAKSLYGELGGFVSSLIYLPQVLIQAVSMSMVPIVSAYYRVGNINAMRDNVSLGLRMSCLIGFPCALGMMALAKPIMLLLYPYQAESAANAADLLFTLSLGIVFLSVSQTFTGVLQGIGKQMIPVRNLAIGVGCKIVITWTLTGMPNVNIQGAAIGTLAAYGIAAVLNYYSVKKYTGTDIKKGLTFGRPLISAAVMFVMAAGTYRLLMHVTDSNPVMTLISIAAGVVAYTFMMIVTKSVSREEVAGLPGGTKILNIIGRFLR